MRKGNGRFGVGIQNRISGKYTVRHCVGRRILNTWSKLSNVKIGRDANMTERYDRLIGDDKLDQARPNSCK